MYVDKACNNQECMKKDLCARNAAHQNGDQNVKTFGGNAQKGCGKFIQKQKYFRQTANLKRVLSKNFVLLRAKNYLRI